MQNFLNYIKCGKEIVVQCEFFILIALGKSLQKREQIEVKKSEPVVANWTQSCIRPG